MWKYPAIKLKMFDLFRNRPSARTLLMVDLGHKDWQGALSLDWKSLGHLGMFLRELYKLEMFSCSKENIFEVYLCTFNLSIQEHLLLSKRILYFQCIFYFFYDKVSSFKIKIIFFYFMLIMTKIRKDFLFLNIESYHVGIYVKPESCIQLFNYPIILSLTRKHS
jgi:hypothetical protein